MNWGDERLPHRFWDKTIPCPTSGCRLWLAATNERGYGRFNMNDQLLDQSERAWFRAPIGAV